METMKVGLAALLIATLVAVGECNEDGYGRWGDKDKNDPANKEFVEKAVKKFPKDALPTVSYLPVYKLIDLYFSEPLNPLSGLPTQYSSMYLTPFKKDGTQTYCIANFKYKPADESFTLRNLKCHCKACKKVQLS